MQYFNQAYLVGYEIRLDGWPRLGHQNCIFSGETSRAALDKKQTKKHFHPVLTTFHLTGYVPPDVKYGIVTPFYKGKGDRADLANWRPIPCSTPPTNTLLSI